MEAPSPAWQMEGEVVHVSSQASAGSSRGGLPSFAVTVVVEHLDAADRQRLRLGMSADVEVQVRDEPRALLVPLAAVHTEGDSHWVNVRIDEDRFERRAGQGGRNHPSTPWKYSRESRPATSWRWLRTNSELRQCRTVSGRRCVGRPIRDTTAFGATDGTRRTGQGGPHALFAENVGTRSGDP